MALRSPLPLGRTSKAIWDLPVSNNCSMSYLQQNYPHLSDQQLHQSTSALIAQEEMDTKLCYACLSKQAPKLGLLITHMGVSAESRGRSRILMSLTWTLLLGSMRTSSLARMRPTMSFLPTWTEALDGRLTADMG